jgi:hypothetical protein
MGLELVSVVEADGPDFPLGTYAVAYLYDGISQVQLRTTNGPLISYAFQQLTDTVKVGNYFYTFLRPNQGPVGATPGNPIIPMNCIIGGVSQPTSVRLQTNDIPAIVSKPVIIRPKFSASVEKIRYNVYWSNS